MNGIREHVSFDMLNDYVDGRLNKHAVVQVSEHIASCAECRSEHGQLVAVVSAASATKLSVEPDDDLWAEIKGAIESGKELVLPTPVDAPVVVHSKRHVRVSPVFLAAAAVILIVLSSGITAVMLRKSPSSLATVENRSDAPKAVLQASFQATEDEYARTIEQLRVVVDAQRSTLSPETVRTVERSLAIVDSAIVEARAALVADPNNRTLVDLLASSYQRKLDLLRRTSELSSKI
jgi:anti-sigma factor RsiW